MSDVNGSSRRAFSKMMMSAVAIGAASEAKAQAVTGSGRYVPFNCTATGSIDTFGGPIVFYGCKPDSDISLMTLMLNFEYLEASFYLYATTGAGLSAVDQGGQARTVFGGRQATFTSPTVAAFAQQLAGDERKHVAVLRKTIVNTGVVPASLPYIDLQAGFTYIMQQAGLVATGQTFDAFANDTNFLLAAYVLEDLLVTTYRGTLTLLSDKSVLDMMSGLTATEGYHAGIVRTLLFASGSSDATNAISHVRSTLDGSAGTPTQGNDHGVGTLTRPSILEGDGDAIVPSRTARQAMDIVFNANAEASPTLVLPRYFFTQGLSSPT